MASGICLDWQLMKTRISPFGRKPLIVLYWWFPAAFLGPFLLAFNPAWQINLQTSALNGFRSGAIGLAIACVLYFLWKIDCRLYKNFKPDRSADLIILLLGILLWLVWFSTCQMILIAGDEVSHADFPPNWQP
jgi:hypothetical protein